MKTIKTFAQMSAIALAGTITFAACSSDDDKVQNINPTYDGKSVKTQFAINIPRAAQQTRQTAEITQNNNNNFRGMTDILLYSAKNAPATNGTALNPITLNTANTGNLTDNGKTQIYSDVTVPIGTSHFLFYGKAPKTEGDNVTTDDNAQYGSLTLTTTNAANGVSNISAELNKIHTTSLSDATLISILNSIVGAKTEENPSKGWTDSDDQTLYNTMDNFTKLKSGSAQSIKAAVERLYNKLQNLTFSHNATENNAIREAIITAISGDAGAFTATETTQGSKPWILDYKDTYTNTINQDFPENLGLPQGVARLTYDNNQLFSYTTNGTLNNINVSTICYPAELYYRANTELYASTTSDDVEWPTSLEQWNAPSSWTNWTSSVAATTRTIALKENINYAVALLKTVVQISDNITDYKLTDNAEAFDQIVNAISIHNNNSLSFQLSGILIGGQPSQVDWKFEPISNASFDYTVYDNQMNNSPIGIGQENPTEAVNYTMLLDNLGSGENGGEGTVNVALELVNNSGQEFYGQDGIVPVGGKFYLVGQLNPTANSGVTQPSENANLDRVFIQDYTTTANFTISSLKNAYMTIPDLRSTQLKLGLSVDLEWKAGLTFNVTIN